MSRLENLAFASHDSRRVEGASAVGTFAFAFLLLYFSVYILHPQDFFPSLGRLPIAEIPAILAIAAYALVRLSREFPLLWRPELTSLGLLTIWFGCGIPFSIWKGGSFGIFAGTWMKILTITFLVSQTLRTLNRVRVFLTVLIACSAVVTLATLIFLRPDDNLGASRLLGNTTGPLDGNFFAIVFAMQLPCIAAFLVHRRSLATSIALLGWLCLMTRMLFLNASRGGTLTVLFSLFLTYRLILNRSHSKYLRKRFFYILLVGALLAPTLYWARIATLWGTNDVVADPRLDGSLASLEERRTALYRSIEYTLENPIFGLGMGNFELESATRSGKASGWVGTHNTYTQVSSEGGFPALLLFLSALGYTFADLRRIAKSINDTEHPVELVTYTRAVMIGLLACSFGALFAHIAYNMYIYPWIGLTVALRELAQQYKPRSRRRNVRVT